MAELLELNLAFQRLLSDDPESEDEASFQLGDDDKDDKEEEDDGDELEDGEDEKEDEEEEEEASE